MRAVGIMGGTFDPIHLGHLAVAELARVTCGLNQVIFVPAGRPPHKEGKVEASPEARYRMTVLATAGDPNFAVSRWELDGRGPSYTLETLRHFRSAADKLYFIMGSDSLVEVRTWHAWEELTDVCDFIVADRPGFPVHAPEWRASLPATVQKRIHFLDGPNLKIAATEIRERIRSKKSVGCLLPGSVEQYIMEKELYRLVQT